MLRYVSHHHGHICQIRRRTRVHSLFKSGRYDYLPLLLCCSLGHGNRQPCSFHEAQSIHPNRQLGDWIWGHFSPQLVR